MSISRTRLESVDRRWTRFVFGSHVRSAFLAWLGLSTMGMLAGSLLGLRQLSSASVGYSFPLLFACTCALVASAFGLQASTALARGKVLVGLWMAGWTAILLILCLAGVNWLVYGLTGEARP